MLEQTFEDKIIRNNENKNDYFLYYEKWKQEYEFPSNKMIPNSFVIFNKVSHKSFFKKLAMDYKNRYFNI